MQNSAEAIPQELLARLAASRLSGLYKVELRGDDGGQWFVRLNAGTPEILASVGAGEYPDVILRSDPQSLKALVEGRMSFSDGVVSERLSMVGDITKIVALKQAIAAKPQAERDIQ